MLRPQKGIFAVGRTFSGLRSSCTEVHLGNRNQVVCELENCKQASEFSRRSNLLGFECIHVRSLYCPTSSKPDVTLKEEVLSDMVGKKWISDNTKRMCLVRKEKAVSENIPLSKVVTFCSGASRVYVSVLETCTSYYSRLGRVSVCYDIKRNAWQCPCSKPKNSCAHKSIAKWHLNQTRPELFLKVRSTDSDVFETFDESDPEGHSTEDILYPPEGAALTSLVLYLLDHKKLPAVLSTDACSPQNMETLPKRHIPLENFCTVCPGKIPLSDPMPITHKANIVTFTGIVKDVSTYCKRCGLCGHFYRYQEWTQGLHNFDDHTILSLHLCLFFRQSVQNHTAVGRALDILEQTNNEKYPKHDSILHGYLHFEAMTAHDYNFSCVHCGVHPPVVIMDLHKKGVFTMAGNRDNPCRVSPSFHKWAPWIGPRTRSSKCVLNTEFSKVKKSDADQVDIDVTEERLSTELTNLKVEALRNLVKGCGIDSKGSKIDLILRLREAMKTRSTYDKVWGHLVSVKCPFS
ncbi:uncharacterized protein LOC117553198 isoform X1 [Gymnodraco acuticeps]|uniref:Uncharacterized protein LOC117553198 isoform X1 n=1 Tax=Gymnodraco acuticeps TaxID=8218 RepID=A0A6P8VB01_GYMAC|nr:uncharacterized protein LOC117553198 isoform X1 [Gymnodraco acuticeps]XP_034082899.1 uncharacterized protein LOC117553198 isoform X1 [Gymnodraco acuticeps]XP_034082900.1 uncharacterized protein LOC117553198 isoform X1 [Gymnodraco acuticeps]XP_034082901.1 uncharacterized protein LOC117553198 isoform X1 [Gymnodraco acuticeps]